MTSKLVTLHRFAAHLKTSVGNVYNDMTLFEKVRDIPLLLWFGKLWKRLFRVDFVTLPALDMSAYGIRKMIMNLILG